MKTKKIMLILLMMQFFLISGLLFAQEGGKKSIDEKTNQLLNELENTPDSPEKVDIFVKLAKAYLRSGPGKALDYGNRGVKLGKEIDYPKGTADCLNIIGRVYLDQGNHSQAKEYLSRGLEIREKIGDKKGIAGSYLNIGIIYDVQGNYSRALEYYTKSLRIKEEIGDKKGIADSYHNIGIIYNNQGNYTRALEYYTRGLRILEELGDKRGIADSYHNIAIIYFYQGNISQALERFIKSLRFYEEIGDKRGIAHSCHSISTIYSAQGNYSRALAYCFKSLRFAEEIGYKRGIAYAYHGIGNIYDDQGNYSRALEYYFKSLRIEEEMGFKDLVAASFNNIGNIYEAQGNYSQALDYHFKSLRFMEEIGNKSGIAISYTNIGNTYEAQGNYSRALEYCFKSLRISERIGNKSGIAISYHGIGSAYRKLGQYKQSQRSLIKALKLSEEIGDQDIMKRSCEELSLTYAAVGNFKKAYEYHKQYAALRESIFDKEKTKEIAKIQSIYEVEKKEKENQILARDNQIQRLALAKQQNMVVTLVAIAGLLFILTFVGFNRFRLKKKSNILIQAEKEKAEQANRAKSRFLANMSHEIRTPLNAILGFSEILFEESTDPQHKSYLQTVSSSGKNLLALLNDVLDLSRIEAGKMELHYESTSPRDLLEETRQIFATKAREKGLNIQVEIDPVLPGTLLLDTLRMRQVLLNLTGNAVKFTDRGFIKLSASTVRRDGQAENDPDTPIVGGDNRLDIVFAVQDSGIGIPEDQQQHIFEAFQQQEGQEMDKYGGTGLGLAICLRFVEMMGGKISLESETGKGSTFRILLKNVAVPAAEKEKEIEKQPPPENIRFGKASILVVDDKEKNRRLLIKYLGDSPLEFIEAENGKEALEKVKQHRPTLVLLDYKMPVMNGIAACKILKADEALNSIPVIIVTASALKEQRAQIAGSGCDGLLNQPVSKSDLILELKRFLPYTTIETAQPAAAAAPGAVLLSPEARRKLPELLAVLRGEEVTRKWETLKETLVFGEIKKFSDEMQELGREYKSGILSQWADLMLDHLQTFDIDKIEKALSNFPGLIETLSDMAKEDEDDH